LDDALNLYEEEWEIRKKYGIEEGIPALLGNMALIYHTRGDNSRALNLFDEEERICRKIGDKKNIASALANKATIRQDEGDLKTALALLDEAETIGKELDDIGIKLTISLDRANIFLQRGELVESLKIYQNVEHTARDLGSKEFLIGALCGQARISRVQGDLNKARLLFEETAMYFKESGDFEAIIRVQGDLAHIYYLLEDRDKSENLYKEIQKKSREIDFSEGIGLAAGNLAVILKDKGQYDEALEMHKEQEHLCRSRKDNYGTAISLIGQGSIFHTKEDVVEAMKCYSEAESILRDIGEPEALATCLLNEALLLAQYNNQPQRGYEYAKEAYSIAADHGYVSLAQQILHSLTSIQKQLGTENHSDTRTYQTPPDMKNESPSLQMQYQIYLDFLRFAKSKQVDEMIFNTILAEIQEKITISDNDELMTVLANTMISEKTSGSYENRKYAYVLENIIEKYMIEKQGILEIIQKCLDEYTYYQTLAKEGSEKSIAYFSFLLSIDPLFDDAWLDKGNTCNILHKYDLALECFDNAIKANPDNEDAKRGREMVIKIKSSR
jgi:tetratricopeptide (TPR) repeat protein